MNRYRTVAVQTTINHGRVALRPEQAAMRSHAIQATDEQDVYEVLGPINFKAGEVIGWDGELPKGMAETMVAEDGQGARSAKKKRPGRTNAAA